MLQAAVSRVVLSTCCTICNIRHFHSLSVPVITGIVCRILRHVEPTKTTARSPSRVPLRTALTKNEERRLRRWPQPKPIDPDRDYYTGKPLSGTWGGRQSIEPTREKPIADGPEHRVMQFDMGRRGDPSRN